MNAETSNVVPLTTRQDPIEFLREFFRPFSAGVYIQLVAILPDGGEASPPAIAILKGDEEALRPFVEQYQDTHGLYFGVGALAHDPGKKASRRDVAAVAYVHCDFDPQKGVDLVAERERLLQVARSANPPPNVIVDSGRGYGVYWRLAEPVRAASGGWGDVEKLNKRAIGALGTAPGTHDVSRLMRLPGTTNFPNESKRASGFIQPTPTRVIHLDDGSYTRELLAQLQAGAGGLDDLPVSLSAEAKRLIREGDRGNKKYGGDRSRLLAAAVHFLRSAGVEVERIHTVCSDPVNACSAHVLALKDEGQRRRAIDRCIELVDADQSANESVVDEMNRQHALIWNGSRVAVTREVWGTDGQLEDIGFAELWALKEFYRNAPPVVVGDKPISRVDYWLAHAKRRECARIVLDPNDTDPRHINLWRGWPIPPNPQGSCERWLEHVFENVANRDTVTFEYLLNWLADLVQFRPLPEVAIVLKSEEEGTGKGTFVQAPGRLLGRHFKQFASTQQFLGRFNSELKHALLVFADEAVWGGDQQSRGKLYALVTEKTLSVEEKFKDASRMANRLRLVIAGNGQWIVPAGVDARRFAVFEVSDRRVGDTAYFDRIHDELDHGGYGRLLHMLLSRDLSGVNLKRFPRTDALLAQKMENASAEIKFLLNIAMDGALPGDAHAEGRTNKAVLWESFLIFAKKIGGRYPSTPIQLGVFLKNWVEPRTVDARLPKPEPWSARDYQFPDLATTRAMIAERLRQKVSWPEEPTNWEATRVPVELPLMFRLSENEY